ncbi:MAG: hypothetical protein ACYTG7_24860, partial [Planctomycetota bacterium]
MNRSLLLILCLLGLLCGSLPGQEPQEKPLQEDVEKLRKKDLLNPAIADPELLVEALRDSFRHWPRHREGVDAVANVIEGGRDTIPYLMKLLDDRDYRLKPAVAHMLSSLIFLEADRETAKAKIKPLLSHPKLRSSYKILLQSLHRLDRADTERLSIELLVSKDGVHRQAAFSILSKNDVPLDKTALHALLKTTKGETRHKVFQLLMREPDEKLDQEALTLMGDTHASMAAAVNRYLGGRNTAGVKEGLESRLSFEPDREFAFALAALVRLEQNYKQALLREEYVPDLENFLSSRDPLFRVSAAAALANICNRSGKEADINKFRTLIVPTLMDVYLKNRYFKDFNCMLEVAAESLRIATGAP